MDPGHLLLDLAKDDALTDGAWELWCVLNEAARLDSTLKASPDEGMRRLFTCRWLKSGENDCLVQLFTQESTRTHTKFLTVAGTGRYR